MKLNKLSVFFLFITLFGCATSSGTLFRDTMPAASSGSDKQEADSEDQDYQQNEDITEGLTIVSDPSGARVYINHSLEGETPLTLELDSGKYRITVKKDGYYSESRWIEYTKGEIKEINFPLELITGYLYLTVDPPDASVKASSFGSISEGVTELPVGRYTIKADRFSYEHFETEAVIYEKETTNINIKMNRAEFSFSPLHVSREVFNPDNPSALGVTRITFTVTAYGSGTLIIKSDNGTEVVSHRFPAFTDWNQSYTWNGRDNRGRQVPDGTYTVTVAGKDETGKENDQQSISVSIDHSLIIKDRNCFSGAAGTMFTPTTDILPPGSFQISVDSLGHFENSGYRFPSMFSLRTAPANSIEADITGGIIIQSPPDNGYFGGISLKKELIPRGSSIFSAAALLKGTYIYGADSDSMSNFTGFTIGLPAALSAGPVTLAVSPELLLSPDGIYGYGRCAVIADFGSAWAGLSGVLRTSITTDGVEIDYPAAAGAEFHWILPGTGIILSAYISGEFDPDAGYYLNSGGGLGLIH